MEGNVHGNPHPLNCTLYVHGPDGCYDEKYQFNGREGLKSIHEKFAAICKGKYELLPDLKLMIPLTGRRCYIFLLSGDPPQCCTCELPGIGKVGSDPEWFAAFIKRAQHVDSVTITSRRH